MTEMHLDALFRNPQLRCPSSDKYGEPLLDFFASPLYRFHGQTWQLRTLQAEDKNSRLHRVFPVAINTGGSSFNRPIFTDAVRKMFMKDYDRVTWHQRSTNFVSFPTPLGDDFDIAQHHWDSEREKDIKGQDALVYNFVGHQLAEIITGCNFLVCALRMQAADNESAKSTEWYRDVLVRNLVKNFAALGCRAEYVNREVDSMLRVPPELKWSDKELPVPKALWMEAG